MNNNDILTLLLDEGDDIFILSNVKAKGNEVKTNYNVMSNINLRKLKCLKYVKSSSRVV